MVTEAEIMTKYKALHDKLSIDYYQNQLLSKADFDHQHGNVWADMEGELIASGFRPLLSNSRLIEEIIDEIRDRIKRLEDRWET